MWQYRDTWKEEAGAIVGASSAASSSFSMEDRLMDPSTSEAKTFIERLEAASKRLAENPVLRRPPTPIKVHVRFRPPTNRHDKADGSKNEAKEIVLPLHQKLRLLKAQKAGGKALTSKQALERLTKAGGWFGSRWTEEERVKAGWSLDKEAASAQEEKVVAHVHTIDPGTGRVVMVAPGVGLRGFTFDSVMGQKVSQRHVFDCAARRHIIDFMNGFNATLVMYGQTGSGKTHTMFGPDVSEEDAKSTYVSTQRRISNERGIVPRAVEEIFGAIEDRKIQGIEARVYVSYVEIFGHEVFDLLRGGAPVANSKLRPVCTCSRARDRLRFVTWRG